MGSLARIDPRYDIAISTAASGYMNHILVESIEVAEMCVQKLRQNNLSRENFICRN
jgi:structural maintenance of chromosome 4